MKEFTLKETEKFPHLTIREVMEKIECGEIGNEVKECEAKAIELGFKVITN